MQGDIGVARSIDKGATWQQLGIALDEDWHLSYPYVFEYNGNVRSQLIKRRSYSTVLHKLQQKPCETTFIF